MEGTILLLSAGGEDGERYHCNQLVRKMEWIVPYDENEPMPVNLLIRSF